MKPRFQTAFLFLFVFSGACFGYGSGSSSKACVKPKFSGFTPAENSETAAGSAFSFSASPGTHAESIRVSVKGQAVPVKTGIEKSGEVTVSGTIPANIDGAFARIEIAAEGQNRCKGAGGWLVKIK